MCCRKRAPFSDTRRKLVPLITWARLAAKSDLAMSPLTTSLLKKGGPAALALKISSHFLCGQTVQAGGIAYDHLRNLRLGNSGEVFGNLLPRVREGALGMRIVGTPHQTLHTNQLPGQDPRPVVLECRPELPFKVK